MQRDTKTPAAPDGERRAGVEGPARRIDAFTVARAADGGSDPLTLPVGYYAVPDPDDADIMTYWRRAETGKGRQTFAPWPGKARYGPVLLRADVPPGADARTYAHRWVAEVRGPWDERVCGALAADPVTAAARFAELTTRCCCCGRRLTDERSKVYGIGPDCRSGVESGTLAALFVPRVAQAHGRALVIGGAS